MKIGNILIAGLFVAGSAGVVYNHKLKADIVDRPVVRAYNGMGEQISNLDVRIKNEINDSELAKKLEETRNSVVDSKRNFYFENSADLLDAQEEIKALDEKQWLYLSLAGAAIAGLALSRRKQIKL